jgi:uncharacterized protein YjbI with pentapeptide repeats
MANKEHLALLRQGVEAWNKWRKTNRQIKPDLSKVNFSKADLRWANLERANLSGSNFIGADLQESNLKWADLRKANFTGANLSGTNFSGANLANGNIDQVDLSGVDLSGVDLSGVDFSEEDLSGSNLSGSNLSGANLSGSNLSGANLSGANLSKNQALRANFEEAIFTGTCLENWNINSQTNLNNVICDYIYLKENRQERRPHDPNKHFAPGEFTKLFQKALETVDLIFSDGIDWQAFLASFEKLQVECGSDELAIQAIEKKSGGAFVIRVEVPLDADKASIEESFWQKYRPLLEAKDKQIAFYQQEIEFKRQENTTLLGIVETMAEKETSKVNMSFHAPVTGVAGNVEGNQNIYAPEQKQTLAEAAAEIQQLLTQLQSQGFSPEDAQQKAANDLATKAKDNPTTLGKLVKWGQSLGDTAAQTTVSEAAKEVVKLALRLSGVPLP